MILYLGPPSPLLTWLCEQQESVRQADWLPTEKDLDGVDFLLSYNFRYILKPDVLNRFPLTHRINLHISLLPWNRGADPNFWSWIDDTPKGVTIHALTEGMDEGPILVQGFGIMDEHMTLRESYRQLHEIIQKFCRDYWTRLRHGDIYPLRQPLGGSVHRLSDRQRYAPLWEDVNKLYDMPIEHMLEWAAEVEQSRAFNWS